MQGKNKKLNRFSQSNYKAAVEILETRLVETKIKEGEYRKSLNQSLIKNRHMDNINKKISDGFSPNDLERMALGILRF